MTDHDFLPMLLKEREERKKARDAIYTLIEYFDLFPDE